jgi:hypothetical protein
MTLQGYPAADRKQAAEEKIELACLILIDDDILGFFALPLMFLKIVSN